VPDLVAKALGANLFFTRLSGHGRGGAALATATAGDWLEDTAEAMAIGRAIGRQVIVIATSTGGTLAAIAATDAGQIDAVKGIAFVSPNFRMKNAAAFILTAPFGRYWGPLLAGEEIGFEPVNAAQARFWTTRYPSGAAFPVGALVKYAHRLDYSGVTTPALFLYSEGDQVVSPGATEEIAERWGGAMEILAVTLPPGSDPYGHILAGDVLSPGNTDATVRAILDWAGRL
jgi:alpha-beta hydrolase superfamily lysophospholipase